MTDGIPKKNHLPGELAAQLLERDAGSYPALAQLSALARAIFGTEHAEVRSGGLPAREVVLVLEADKVALDALGVWCSTLATVLHLTTGKLARCALHLESASVREHVVVVRW